MELPFICRNCRHENWVDPDSLARRPLDKLMTAEEFVCEKCGKREAVWFSTFSLEAALDKLPGRNNLPYYFSKVLKKAQGINERGEKIWLGLTSKLG